jgi:hypothetical protein
MPDQMRCGPPPELALAGLAEADRITSALIDGLWSQQLGIFVARNARTGQLHSERTVAGLLPLLLPGLPEPLVAALIATVTGGAFRAWDDGSTMCRASS